MEGDFMELLHFLSVICWQALGKVANPASGKADKNLEFAKRIIDIFETLQEKTKGNLTADEVRMLEYTLAELRMNYVDEKAKDEAGAKAQDVGKKHEDENKKEPA